MLNTIQGLTLLAAVEIAGPIVLAIALAYGVLRASRRQAGNAERRSVEATRDNYRAEEPRHTTSKKRLNAKS